MRKKFSRVIGFLLVSLVVLTAGCGSEQESIFTGGSSLTTQVPSQPVFGKANLGVPFGGGVARAVALDNSTIATSPVDAGGNFRFDSAALPSDFRVVVADSDNSITLASDVRGFIPGTERFFWVTGPTSLVSAYLASHPGETLEGAEARARRVLGLRSHVDLGAGVEESGRSPFSHLAFMVEASQAGGLDPFVRQLVVEMEQANQSIDITPRFQLTRSDFSASLSGLEPGARAIALLLQSNEILQLSVVGDVFEDSLKFVGQGVAGSIINSATSASWTWLSSQLGLSYGTTNQLNEIEGQLNDLIGEIAAFETSVADTNYSNAAAAINTDAIDPLNTLQSNLTTASSGFDPTGNDFTTINGQSQSVQTLLNTLGQFDAENALQEIQNYMLGTNNQTNMNTLALELSVTNVLGVDAPARFARMPWRKNSWLDTALKNQNFYTGYQNLSANWLAESAHQVINLASGINDVIPTLDTAAASLKQQRGQFPYYMPSDNLIVDLENGIMWYAEFQTQRTYSEAVSFASSFSVQGNNYSTPVTYDDWRLPTAFEAVLLQQRGRLYNGGIDSNVEVNSNNGYGDYGRSAAGLPGMGFTNMDNHINSDGDIWYADYFLDTSNNTWIANSNYEFRLNHEKQNTEQKDDDDVRPFFMCRSITRPLYPVGLALFFDPNNPPALPFSTNPIQPIEYLGLGVVTGVNSPANGGYEKVGASLQFTIWQGGNYTAGDFPDSSDNLSGATPEPDPPVANISFDGSTDGVQTVPWFTSDNAELRVSNYPGDEGTEIYTVDDTGANIVTNVTTHAMGYDRSSSSFPVQFSQTHQITQRPINDQGEGRKVLQIQVSPRNRLYDYPNGTTQQENYYAVAFYDNFTVEDVTDQVTWTLLQYDPNSGSTTALPNNYVGAEISNQEPGLLQLDKSTNTIEYFTIQATLDSDTSFSNSVNLQVITD